MAISASKTVQTMRIYFGGTFDPVHIGHLQLAQELSELFHQDKVYLLPCYQAVHKEEVSASAAQRLAMLQLAIKDYPNVCIDTREVLSAAPSYTFNTLNAIREEVPDEAIAFVIGTDSLITFPDWFRSEKMASLTNLIVIERPEGSYRAGLNNSSETLSDSSACNKEKYREYLDRVLDLGFKLVKQPELLEINRSGLLISLKLSLLAISSTEIRSLVRENKAVNHLVSDAVAAYIKEYKLYQN